MRPQTISPEPATRDRHIVESDVYRCAFSDANSLAMSLMHKAREALLRREYEDGRIFIDQAQSVIMEYETKYQASVDGLRKRLSRLESLLHGSTHDSV